MKKRRWNQLVDLLTGRSTVVLRFLASRLLNLPFMVKQCIVLSVDLCLCVLATFLAFYLRLGEFLWMDESLLAPVFVSIALAVPIFACTGLYRGIFRYSGSRAIVAVGRATSVYSLFYIVTMAWTNFDSTPSTVKFIQPLLLFSLVAGSRLFARLWLGLVDSLRVPNETKPRVLIYGAGLAGRQLAHALSNGDEMKVVGFCDDDVRLHGRLLNGLPIFGSDGLSDLIASKDLTHILVAMPSVSRSRRNEVLKYVSAHSVAVRTLPSLADLAEGRVKVSDVKDLDVNDLLGRDHVAPNPELLAKNVTGKTVLVLGAGGSIGSELCRQVLKLRPTKLLLVELNEYALYTIHAELETIHASLDEKVFCSIVPLLASVNDDNRMREIMETWQLDTIYHAAAYKHVPLVEHNLTAGVKNNVFGSLTVAQLAIETGVSDFVLVSTDKAVRPTNVMGASKRLAELCLQALYEVETRKKSVRSKLQRTKIKMSMVRFGNVLDSSGSVIPKFREQIHNGGPITLTHPDITRYFMTIPEAAQLVIQAGAMAEGGDVFVLDMGEPVQIAHLARNMVELSGFTLRDEGNPRGDIEIIVTGLRPGEKLYEELLLGDNPQPTQHAKIQRAQDSFIPWAELEPHLCRLKLALTDNNVKLSLSVLQELVAGYTPNEDIVDWVYLEKSRPDNATPDSGCSSDTIRV